MIFLWITTIAFFAISILSIVININTLDDRSKNYEERRKLYLMQERFATSGWISGILFIVFGFILMWNTLGYRDIQELKEKSPQFLGNLHYNNVEYIDFRGAPAYGGFTSYQARDTNNLLYIIETYEWRGKILVGNVQCLNAISKHK